MNFSEYAAFLLINNRSRAGSTFPFASAGCYWRCKEFLFVLERPKKKGCCENRSLMDDKNGFYARSLFFRFRETRISLVKKTTMTSKSETWCNVILEEKMRENDMHYNEPTSMN